MKRSGRNIVKMTLGLIVFTLIIGWLDGVGLDPAELEKLDSSLLPNSVRSISEGIRQAGDTSPVYLVIEKGAVSEDLIDWVRASIPDPIVKLQVRKVLSSSYPEKGFAVIRFRNLKSFSQAMQTTPGFPRDDSDGILFSSQRFVLNLKGVVAAILAAVMLVIIRKLDKPVNRAIST